MKIVPTEGREPSAAGGSHGYRLALGRQPIREVEVGGCVCVVNELEKEKRKRKSVVPQVVRSYYIQRKSWRVNKRLFLCRVGKFQDWLQVLEK